MASLMELFLGIWSDIMPPNKAIQEKLFANINQAILEQLWARFGRVRRWSEDLRDLFSPRIEIKQQKKTKFVFHSVMSFDCFSIFEQRNSSTSLEIRSFDENFCLACFSCLFLLSLKGAILSIDLTEYDNRSAGKTKIKINYIHKRYFSEWLHEVENERSIFTLPLTLIKHHDKSFHKDSF